MSLELKSWCHQSFLDEVFAKLLLLWRYQNFIILNNMTQIYYLTLKKMNVCLCSNVDNIPLSLIDIVFVFEFRKSLSSGIFSEIPFVQPSSAESIGSLFARSSYMWSQRIFVLEEDPSCLHVFIREHKIKLQRQYNVKHKLKISRIFSETPNPLCS